MASSIISRQEPNNVVRAMIQITHLVAAATSFKQDLRDVVPPDTATLIIDMRNVQVMDSSGLGSLLSLPRIMPEGIKIRLIHLKPSVKAVVDMLHLGATFSVE
ncbi:MAG: STAS domain-containing protein [Candidatus Methylacidiphilales bacterium]|nr:STAS domain-containing protein [Candidatus Methylacidiphilales bacterium]